jgi:hypothetical protein
MWRERIVMPSVSKAQRRKMAVLHEEGKITDTQFKHFKKIVPHAPERVKTPKKGKK